MYHKILVPVELAHLDKLFKALNTAIDMARHYNATLCYVTVTNSTPSPAAHNTRELTEKLKVFAKEQGEEHGIKTDYKVIESPDTAAELDEDLLTAIEETGADLVVMASHPPGTADKLHILRSNGAKILRHSDVSMFVVR
ncbi:MAG: universal stress protein [Marinobacter sp.]|uniref:universal stress protein n=1 Tax=Marinobacter sp. TaxID=50741 RepID=UPI00299D0A33|nr:universal stress protein [Marinobacter sp.]MDX1755403.1 universal stress protein [Marinobacter sp.]